MNALAQADRLWNINHNGTSVTLISTLAVLLVISDRGESEMGPVFPNLEHWQALGEGSFYGQLEGGASFVHGFLMTW